MKGGSRNDGKQKDDDEFNLYKDKVKDGKPEGERKARAKWLNHPSNISRVSKCLRVGLIACIPRHTDPL